VCTVHVLDTGRYTRDGWLGCRSAGCVHPLSYHTVREEGNLMYSHVFSVRLNPDGF
jgi:hypothetical protein